jgi:hypothetical protein
VRAIEDAANSHLDIRTVFDIFINGKLALLEYLLKIESRG